jgi:hypothetical protein
MTLLTYLHKFPRTSLAIFSLLWLTLFVFLLVIYPVHRKNVVLELETNTPSYLRIFWGTYGESYSHARSAFILTKTGRHLYTFHVDGRAPIEKLRIDPTVKSNEWLSICQFRLTQPGYEKIHLVSDELEKMKPINGIGEFKLDGKRLYFQTTHKDSQLEYKPKNNLLEGGARYQTRVVRALNLALLTTVICAVLAFSAVLLVRLSSPCKSVFDGLGHMSLSPLANRENRAFRLLPVATFLVAIFLLGWFLNLVYSAIGDVNVFGSSQAPHSDALMWFRGTVHYLDGMTFKTYRPTVNLFFGAIYSLFESVQSIPLWGVLFFCLNVLVFILVAGLRNRLFMILLLWLFVAAFKQLIEPLNVGQLMVEFLPFSFVLFGVIMTGLGLKERYPLSLLLSGVGIFFVGAAIALRGVHLLGGLMLVGIVFLVFWQKGRRGAALSAPLLLMTPLALDICLQQLYGAENNGLFSLFCFYHDPSSSYTVGGKHLLRALALPSSEVILNYGRFLFSFQGLEVWDANIKDLTNQGITILCSPGFLTILFTSSFVSLVVDRFFLLTPSASMGRYRILQHCIHVLLFPVLYLLAPGYGYILLLVYCTVLLVASYWGGLYMTCGFLTIFIGGVVFFAMLGMPGGDRVSATYLFALPAGWLSYLVESKWSGRKKSAAGLISFGILNCCAILFLYLGSIFIPPPQIARLEPGTVLKLSDDSTIDRSLFYTSDGQIFYTHFAPDISGMNRYVELNCPKGIFNGSYNVPCQLVLE